MKVFVVRKKNEFYLESGDSRCSNIPIVSLRYFWAQEGVRDGKLSAILFINFALEIDAIEFVLAVVIVWLHGFKQRRRNMGFSFILSVNHDFAGKAGSK